MPRPDPADIRDGAAALALIALIAVICTAFDPASQPAQAEGLSSNQPAVLAGGERRDS